MHGTIADMARRSSAKGEETDWLGFPDLPGTHATWRNPHLELASGQVVVTMQPPKRLIVEGRTYEMRRNGKQAETLSKPFDLVDATTGQPVLRIERVPEGRTVFGQVRTDTHRYAFPVQGRRVAPPCQRWMRRAAP